MPVSRLFLCPLFVCVVLAATASPVRAQYGAYRVPDPATGERYRVEIAANAWNPAPDIVISSESLGILGSDIDFVKDLGLSKKRVGEYRAILRLARKHKLRVHFVPLSYQADATLTRSLVFNGIRYEIGIPVSSSFKAKSWRFMYEYDFIYRDRGFLGIIVEAKYNDVQARLTSVLDEEFAEARVTVPAIGGIGRVYVMPNIALTGEVTYSRFPSSIDERYQGDFLDWDAYATLNFTDKAGIQGGYRTFDVSYRIEQDQGKLSFKGWYFGGVARF